MVALISSFGGVLGLVAGSFLNVVAHRVPAGVSVVTPRSACPRCGTGIRNRDNIPVVSWLLLRGRCRDCNEPISIRYPVVEATTALLFSITGLIVGLRWVLPAYWVFVGVTVALTLTDLDRKLIPNRILFPGAAVAGGLLAAGAILDGELHALGRGVIGAAGYFAALFLLALAARGGFGFGDVKLAFLLGLFLAYRGWEELFVAVFLAFALGGAFSIVLLAMGRKGRKDAIPFGPFLVLGAYLAIAVGGPIATWYLGV